eukprot:m.173411 g.173411  ORF g.173411 m.173411 type:complete len:128 (-) comp15387_c0_seq4:1261-1644(-)
MSIAKAVEAIGTIELCNGTPTARPVVSRQDRMVMEGGLEELDAAFAKKKCSLREYQYLAALGNIKLGKYKHARALLTELLQSHPNDRQAIQLQSILEETLMHDGMLGLAILGVATAAVAGLAWLRRR